jgi:hypothetical protein
MGMAGEFSVYQFFPDETWDRTAHFVDAKSAVEEAKRLTTTPMARFGIVRRIIITDGGDFTCFEWQHGKGVTFPTPEQREAARQAETEQRPD